jgi:hypothetical protein
VPPAPGQHSSFNIFGFVAGVGAVLAAIGHHGQPGSPCVSCVVPSPSAPTFSIIQFVPFGHPPTGSIEFDFSEVVDSTSQTGIQGSTSYASFVMEPPNSNATTAPAPLQQLGTVTFTLDPTGTMSILTVSEQNGLVGGKYDISFTGLTMSTLGASLVPESTGLQPFALIRHIIATPHRVGPVAPGPGVPGVPKPGVPKQPPVNPKPPPVDPHIPN